MQKIILALFVLLISTIANAQPVITSFSPTAGIVGSSVTISGNNFSTTPASNIVYFGAVRAVVTASTVNSITATVPAGATHQSITVTVSGLTAYSNSFFIVTYPNGSTITPSSFETKVDFETGIMPHDVIVADFDGDGKPDIATANNFISGVFSSISLLRNTSTGSGISFAPKQDFVNGAGSFGIACGDIDGDGKTDIAVNSNFDSKISVFRNTSTVGAISFAPKVEFPSGSNAYAIVIRDVDGDGKSDISFINNVSSGLSIYRNTGSIGTIAFAPRQDFATALTPYDLVSSDFDGDGKTDFAVSNNNGTSVSIYRNTSSPGTLAMATPVDIQNGAGNKPFGLNIADLDSDGKMDFMVMIQHSGGSAAQLFRNTSTPGVISFPFGGSVSAGNNIAYHVGAGDVNGDGKPDLVLGSTHLSKNVVFQNNSVTPGFSFGVANDFYSFNPYTVLFADLDADSKPELLAGDFTGDDVAVLKNRCGIPAIISFNPTTAASGATVTITGNYFTGATAVSFGGVPASSFIVVNSTTITAVVGSGASGDVSVTTPFGTATLGGFTFVAPPTITSFLPASAATGTTVTITGTNFTNATAVSFGGVAASSFIVVSSTTITAIVAGGASGSVSVTTMAGTATLAGFTYIPPPVITSFDPTSAGTGTTVTITGSNFTGATTVRFGGVAATSFVVVTSTTITAIVGTGATGSVEVTTPGGTASLAGFTYIFPVPTITSITPSSGSYGDIITITGTNLSGSTAVSFGGTAALSFIVVNPTTITALVGTGASGNVSVTTAGGTANFAGFVFHLPPVVTSIAPGSGPVGTSLVINGTNFNTTAAQNIVYLGAVKGSVVSATSNQLNVTVPAGITFQPVSVTANKRTGYSARPFNLTFTGGTGGFASNSFTPLPNIPVGNTVVGSWISDVDGDGKPDLMTSNESSSNLSVLRNTSTSGNITFAPKIDMTIGSFTNNIITSDFNSDGLPDIAVGYSSNVGVFKNTSTPGVITFNPLQSFGSIGGPTGIAAADFDGDGRPDLALSKNSSLTMSVLRNISSNDNINFAPELDIDTYSTDGPASAIAVTDIDGDSKPDLVVANYLANTVAVFRNTSTIGNISFAIKITFPAGVKPTRLAVGDIDGDQKVDIVASHNDEFTSSFSAVTVLKNTSTSGNVSFAPKVDFETGTNPHGLTFQDLDGDGKTDLGVTHRGSNFFSILQNTSTFGSITFNAAVQYTSSFSSKSISSSDFDGDTKSDLAVSTGSDIIIYKNKVGEGPGTTITFFSPAIAGTGAVITINGTNFTGATAVSFGGIPAASFIVVSSTQMTAVVGAGQSGSVAVTTPLGTVSVTGFVFVPAPTISSFTPTTASTGAIITITGANFTGATAVSFGGVAAASFNVVSPSSITAIVANGATGNVNVTTPGGTATGIGFAYLGPPTITSFTPASGGNGTSVSITGTGFSGVSGVTFGGVAATSFVVNSPASITAVVGTGASGAITVTTAIGSGQSTGAGFIFNIVTGIFDPANSNSKELTISPNPASDQVLIKHPKTFKPTRLRFIDMLGREVKTVVPQPNTPETSTNVSKLTRGIYQLTWNDGVRILSRTVLID